MRSKMKNPSRFAFLGIIGLAGVVTLVWKTEPNWISELGAMMLLGCSLGAIFLTVFRNSKIGVLAVLGLMGLLIFNRLGVLDVVSAVLLVVVLGLIALVN